MVGRKPKPTHLHVMDGTLNVTRHRNRENEPVVTGKPVKPKSLNGRASKIWDEVMEFAHWLKIADSHALAIWCRLSAKSEKDFDNMTASMLTQHRAYGSELGFMCASRSRINVDANNDVKKKDPNNYA